MGKFVSDKIRMKSVARLAAVQATYMIEYGDLNVDQAVKDFLDGNIGRYAFAENAITMDEEQVELSEFDTTYFVALIRGVMVKKEAIEESLSQFLNEKWPYDRMDGTLRALLLCALYELTYATDIDAKVIIQEYVDLAYAFFNKNEPKMVNALLDQVAKAVR
jgi:N utilization substance protein B